MPLRQALVLASSGPRWPPGPHEPRLAERAVHVWRADLDRTGDEVARLLCDQERARAERFLSERDGHRWARARGVLRALLGRYLGGDPPMLQFGEGAQGKPSVLEGRARSSDPGGSTTGGEGRLHFNVSHSGCLALYAFSRMGEVGVDVERARRPLNVPGIAARAFGERQAQRLGGLDEAARQREFLRAWVRHEAVVKWRGTGLDRTRQGPTAPRPWLFELELGGGATGALATRSRPPELRCFSWSGGSWQARQSSTA